MELGLGAGSPGMGDFGRRARVARAGDAVLSAMGRWARPTHRVPQAIAHILPGSRDLGLR